MRRAGFAAALLVCLAAGVFLRVTNARTWPRGIWIDEAYALRAARIAHATGEPLSGTTALEPPDAGFVNAWVPNLTLAFVSACDRAAGGGLRALRLVSILPALVLFAASVALAAVSARGRPAAALAAAVSLATSMWLLTTGRWGWDVVATSALLVLCALAGVRAAERISWPAAVAAGALLGLAQYGSVAARLALAVPIGAALLALTARCRREALLALAALGATLLVAAPLGLHYAAHPERAAARTAELGVWNQPRVAATLARNAAVYARLFATGGDPNERHGDPARPVLPAPVAALALLGVATAPRGSRPAVLLSLFAGTLLLGGLLAYEPGGANAYRIAPAAPFLIVLSGLGAAALLERVPPAARRATGGLLGAALLVVALLEGAAFASWARAPRTAGAFGGPERELYDVIRWEEEREGPAEVLLHPTRAARNPYVVDVLLGRPGDPAHALRLAVLAPQPEWRALPARDVLYADADDPGIAFRVEALGGRQVASGRDPLGRPGWALFRIPKDAAIRSALERLALFPRVPPLAAGSLAAEEEGIFSFATRGGVAASLDGRILFDPQIRPGGIATIRLAMGRHALEVRTLVPGARLAVTGADGFALAR